ncbi:hypothetical protein WK62_05235 [Burkholderia ubonensis]|uniref:hypothetical protein n=1 Tax=Burkholderia ubonensis TaxID=101571 RepID=UPI00075AAD9A|nr:hypothetical protein [Burkholderia ubonensis]KVU10669.1 hypothetical protein WK62_05235 [Burkholderia ubonensis]
MAPEEEIIRGGQAAQVLDAPIFVEAKKRVLDGIHEQMKRVPMADQTMHTRLVMTLQLWHALESYLEQAKQTGELADFQIRQEEERRSRFKLFG